MVVGVVHDATDEAALTKAVTAIKATRGVASVATPRLIDVKDGTKVALVDVYSTGAPQDKSTTDLIKRVRDDALPGAVAGSRLHLYVGGDTAIFDDFSHVLARKLPLFVGVVVLLSFLLLAVVFRSIVVPLTAAVMNLLSAGAAFGILVAVFQWGWLGSAFGVTRNGPIEAFIPVMMFAILFGLSMDYEVFLVARIHEEWLHGGDNAKAVRNGLATTGKTITAAALIMILVFGSFILGGERVIKEFGLGLAGGVFIDAVVIRSAIIPAVMFLLGKTNWWFPDRLDKVLPHLSVESEVDDEREPVTV
jgi:RND superfamily putative drug exporter